MRTWPNGLQAALSKTNSPIARVEICKDLTIHDKAEDINFFNAERLDPAWETNSIDPCYNANTGLLNVGSLIQEIDPVTREASIGDFQFTVSKTIWASYCADRFVQDRYVRLFLTTYGYNGFMYIWQGRLNTFQGDESGEGITVSCSGPIFLLHDTKYNLFDKQPNHPLHFMRQIMEENFDISEYDATTFFPTSIPELALFCYFIKTNSNGK
ncbi:MAG: hypothetical protein HC877_20740 [Thioploca sp.]|nr:hypothetical protein [Thioploca sp.]